MISRTETHKFAEIASVVNPDTGEVTLYISNENWGPIVTGKNLADAKQKMLEAFGLSMIVNSFCGTQNLRNELLVENAKIDKAKYERLKTTLELIM